MKVIETDFKGTLFRSRLEARWAVFMDALGVEYIYEPEAFDLDGVAYLPDFYIPHLRAYLEIKPSEPTGGERDKCERLAQFTQSKVYLFWGMPSLPDGYNDSAIVFYPDGGEDFPYWWCQCDKCGLIGIAYSGHNERICNCHKGDRGANYDTDRFIDAYNRAVSFRFWTPKREIERLIP